MVKVKVYSAGSSKWHMIGHMFQPQEGRLCAPVCSLYLSQITELLSASLSVFVSLSPSSVLFSWDFKARLSDWSRFSSRGPNWSFSVKQSLFSHVLIGSKISSLSTAVLHFLIIYNPFDAGAQSSADSNKYHGMEAVWTNQCVHECVCFN